MRFVLVHGGFHAAWCWERTIAALEALGHVGVAVDLPGHGARVDEESTLADRRDAILVTRPRHRDHADRPAGAQLTFSASYIPCRMTPLHSAAA
jgi:pimeloyl-ACP methyl ester carboxylesterase